MPPKRPRNLRKAKLGSADWEGPTEQQTPVGVSNGAEPAANETTIDPADLVEFQKLRSRKLRGVDAEALAKGERKRKSANKPASAVPEDEPDERSKVPRSLDGAFTQQTNKLDANKHMMAFIEEEMRRRRSGGGDEETGDGVGASAAQHADDLYQVPEHLRVVDAQPVSEGNVAMASKMLTSIQEVDLGAENRAHNVRATGQALANPSQLHAGHGEPRDGSRYRRHHNMADRSARATDDAVLQRFKKRMRR
ncbi:hypothetical protein IWW54_006237 [Coemansia sp. RSA 2705]|nr:hypothetical protein IWW54_006237 [Coemansia sp. RSA 2705]